MGVGLGLCCLHCSSNDKTSGGTKKPDKAPVQTDAGKTDGKASTGGGSVAIDGLRCGGGLDDTLQSPFIMITDRQVFVDYPCDLPKGTPVTFVLNLHGTQTVEDGKHYIREYNKLGVNAQEYHFVVATPKAIGSQWGNGDDGQDAPHLTDVVSWVYDNFAGFAAEALHGEHDDLRIARARCARRAGRHGGTAAVRGAAIAVRAAVAGTSAHAGTSARAGASARASASAGRKALYREHDDLRERAATTRRDHARDGRGEHDARNESRRSHRRTPLMDS
jgi:hypothetical protein